jgi:DNA-binding transcriptional LysR family regulator
VDLNHLPLLIAVADSGSFSEAARRLRLPKSSVSRAISALEADMGVRLLNRTTRHVSLSTAGEALYRRVAPALTTIQSSVTEVPERDEVPSGELRVTAAVDVGAAVLAEIVQRFTARYPQVRVDVRLSNRIVDIVKEGFDVALRIARDRLADSSFVAKKAGAVELRLYAAPSYIAKAGSPRSPNELSTHDFVLFRGARTLRLEGTGRSHKLEVTGRIAGDEMFFVRDTVRAGAGIAALPTFLGEADVVSGALVRVLPHWTLRAGSLWLVYPSAKHVPKKVVAFRDFVLEWLRTKPLAPLSTSAAS